MIRWSLKKERPKVVVPTLAKTCNQLFCCQLITSPQPKKKNKNLSMTSYAMDLALVCHSRVTHNTFAK